MKTKQNFKEKQSQKNQLLQIYSQQSLKNQLNQNTTFDPYDQKLQSCKDLETIFVDPEFPPNKTSLSQNPTKMPESWKSIDQYWIRATDIFRKQPSVFQGLIEPSDIKQGILGDCYFLSALSSLSEQPQLIIKLFGQHELIEQGIYGIWLCDQGEWRNVIIDDMFPVINGNCAFSRGNGAEMWVMLLEKAYAKMYGNYEVIEGGNPAHAMFDLTGAPTSSLFDADEDKFFNFVREHDNQRWILCAVTKTTNTKEEENDAGILSGHAYAILDNQEVIGSDGKKESIVKIRNPWGSGEWKGDWSDTSNKWTQDLVKQLGMDVENDGIFWMNSRDFRQHFNGVMVCKVENEYLHDSVKIDTGNNKISTIRMKIQQKGHMYLSVNQKDDRLYYYQQGYEYCFVRLLVGKIVKNKEGNQTLEYITGIFDKARNISIEAEFDVGEYLISIEIEWQHNLTKQLIISSYGQMHAIFNVENQPNGLQTQRLIIRSYAMSQPEGQNSQSFNKENSIQKKNHFMFGLLYLFYKNLSDNQTLKEKVEMTKLQALEIEKPFNDNQLIEFILPPNSETLVVFKIKISNGSANVGFAWKQTSQIIFDNVMLSGPQNYLLLVNKLEIARSKQNIEFDELQDHLEQLQEQQMKKQVKSLENLDDKLNRLVQITNFERRMFTRYDRLVPFTKHGSILLFLTFVFYLFNISITFLKPSFVELTMLLLFSTYVLKNQINSLHLRFYQFFLTFSLINDFAWMIIYTGTWESDSTDPENGMKVFTTVLVYFQFIFKFIYMIAIWRYFMTFEQTDAEIEELVKIYN